MWAHFSFPTLDASVYKNSHFGDGSLSVIVNSLGCSGSEANITECRLDSHNLEAFYGNTAGLRCYGQYQDDAVMYKLLVHSI